MDFTKPVMRSMQLRTFPVMLSHTLAKNSRTLSNAVEILSGIDFTKPVMLSMQL